MMHDTIPLFKVMMNKTASAAVGNVLDSGYIGQGPKVEELEGLLKKRFGRDYLLTLNSGTSALHLAMHMVKSEHNVALTTPLTCTATNWPLLANNYDIRWVDVDPTTLNIDLVDLERKITKDVGVIVVVHWGGYPVDLNALEAIVDRAETIYGHRINVIEDCAHAFGTTFDGQYLGNHGNIAAFSFQAIKHFTTIDGGMLALPNSDLYKRGKLLRWYGIDRENNTKDFRCEADIEEWGFKFHMNDVCAATGIENLKIVNGIIDTHKSNGRFFNKELRNFGEGTQILNERFAHDSSYWIYSLHVERRDDFMRAMTSRGITTSRVHERNDLHSCVADYRTLLPGLESVMKTMICIPSGWWVTQEDREYIIDSIKQGW